MKNILFILLFNLISILSFGQFYNGSIQEFGKNRIQYKEFQWQYYQFEKLDVYFYEGGMDLANHIASIAESQVKEIENKLDYVLQDKIEFIIYNSQTDFKQSNVGLNTDASSNIGGTTQIVGSKIFFFYEGEYNQLLSNLKRGIAQVLVNQMMYGGNWRDVLKNSTLLNLPAWYIDGLVSWASDSDNPEIVNFIKDGVETGKFDGFNWLRGKEATYAGHGIWNYIEEVYGVSVIPNILYMSRISRNVESGFLFVLGMSLGTLQKEFQEHYRNKYLKIDSNKDDIALEQIEYKVKKKHVYSQLKLSPFGDKVAFVSNILGQYRVYIKDLNDGSVKKIAKGQHKLDRLVDNTWPIVSWSPTGDELAFIIEKRGELFMHIYDVNEQKTYKRNLFNIDKVLDMSYSHDGRQMVFSGVKNGQTDLYLYYMIGNRQEKLTNDFFEEINPEFVKNSSRIIFASNRTNDTLEVTSLEDIGPNRDIFILNLNDRKKLERITNTPLIDEIQPAQFDSIRYTFLGKNGEFYNQFIATYDSAISRIDTTIHYRYFTHTTQVSNYKKNISELDVNHRRGKQTKLVYNNGEYQFFHGNLRASSIGENKYEDQGNNSESLENGQEIETTVISIPVDEEQTIDIQNYNFGNEEDVSYEQNTIVIEESSNSETIVLGEENKFKQRDLPGSRNYNVNFTTDYTVTQLNNSFNNNFYNPIYSNEFAGNATPGLSSLIKMGISDLFEDYKIMGGIRPSLDFQNSEQMVEYQNLKKRLDKKIRFERLVNELIDPRNFNEDSRFKINVNVARFQLSYPINEVLRAEGELIARHDRKAYLARDVNSLRRANEYRNQGGTKLSLVFDNTIGLGLNLFQGSRFKLWGEYYQQIDRADSDFFVLGGDFRNYIRIHRNFIFASRIAGSTSFGSERLVYYLGGVDQWFAPRFSDPALPISPDQNFQYQTFATPVRGFLYNARNGNSFAVANLELRLPVFKYFFNKPMKSDFLDNFQIVGFSDVGTAWTGSDPYSEENSFNNEVINNNPLTITIKGRNEPLVGGVGFGLRSRLLGYFVRADWAWGIEDGQSQNRIFYISTSLDF